MIKGTDIYRLITDHLGSVRLVVKVNGTAGLAQMMRHDAWGNATIDDGESFDQPFGFAGGLWDRETGLVHFGARDYDPITGRWLQKDPILFRGGDTNLYAYVGGDPVNRIDPSGLLVIGAGYQAQAGAGVVAASAGGEANIGVLFEFSWGWPTGLSIYGSVGGALNTLVTSYSKVPGAIFGAFAGYGPVFTLGFGSRSDLMGWGLEAAADTDKGGAACMMAPGPAGLRMVGLNVSPPPLLPPPWEASKGAALHAYPTYTEELFAVP